MADVSKYTGLITSEHASAPKFNAMVSAVAQCFVDQQNALGDFIPSFDLDQAVGDQLDTLGAWVGISRRVRTPLTGVYFSFDTAGVGFDQGVWQGPFDPSTGITVLDDDTYRLLIRAKIGANHWDGTLASSAAILNLIFQGGTTPQHLTATSEQFGVGTGSKGTFQLTVGGVPVYSNINVASIFRSDWQGNQLLYATARTNAVINSGSAATWSTSGTPTITANAATAPDGTTTAALVSGTGAATGQGVFRTSTRAGAVNDIVTASYYVKFSSGMSQYRIRLEGAAFPTTVFGIFDVSAGTLISTGGGANLVGTSITNIGGGYYRLTVTGIAQAAGAVNFSCDNAIASAWASNIWGSQVEWSSFPTSYIATTSAAVTITDYSVGSTGLVSMGPKPVTGAQLTWNGSGDAYPSGTHVFIEDNQDMSITFGVAGTIPSALFLALLSGGYIPIKPEGVRVRDYVVTSVSGGPIFGFDMENQFVSGFDVGAWGSPL